MLAESVLVTGMGAASSLGSGLDVHRAALWAARDGIRPVARFDTVPMGTRLGATWPAWDDRTQPEFEEGRDLAATAQGFPLHELAIVAAREAWQSASVEPDPRRVALVFGTCFGQGFDEFSPVAERVASALGVAGPCITISTACASSTNAIGLGRDLLLQGHADVVIAGGADTLLREAFAGFSALGVLSPEACAPFSDPPGTTLGEGAGFLVLERSGDAARRGAASWGTIAGYGLSADAFHETTPHPTGDGVARALRGALENAGWSSSDVDFVSAHATGTSNNDRIEWSVIERELGAVGRTPRVAGSKGHIGHTQGAAGALELILALICHREGHAPPTLHFRGPRTGCPSDAIVAGVPQPMNVERAVKLSAAFGGANAVLAYGCGQPGRPAHRARRSVVVTGGGVVGPRGASRLAGAREAARERPVGRCKEVDLDALGIESRGLDRSSRWLTAAAAMALAEDGRPEDEKPTGLFVAATRMPAESSGRCIDSIRRRGVAGTSAAAFARMSVNAPAGACSEALGLLGPTTTVSLGDGSGLLAIALAAEWLAWREDASSILAAGVDERAGADEAEGAACLALRQANTSGGAIVVGGWGIAGKGCVGDAIARAMAGRSSVDLLFTDVGRETLSEARAWGTERNVRDVIEADRFWGVAEASRSCVLAAIAAADLAAGRARSALVVAGLGASSVAVLFERSDT